MIQKIEINKQLQEFFCPLTGHQILFEDDFVPSPALMFGYVYDEESFVFRNNKIKEDYSEFIDITEDFCKLIDFKKILNDLNNNDEDYLLVEIGDKFGCVVFCFNLRYINEN